MEGEFPNQSGRRRDEKPPAKKPEKKVERVTEGEVVRRKKPLGRRVKEAFFGGDDVRSAWGFVGMEILVPAAKDAIEEAFQAALRQMLWPGAPQGRGRYRSGRPGDRDNFTNYQKAYGRRDDPRDRDRDRSMSRRSRANFDFDEIILAKRHEAEDVLERLDDLIGKYDMATVADLYDLTGIASNYTDEKWGWTDIRGATVTRVTGGYLLDLPRPETIN